MRRLVGLSRAAVRVFVMLCVACGGGALASAQQSKAPEVVFGFDALAAWVDQAASYKPADRTALFERVVIGTYKTQCFTGAALPKDLDQLTGMAFGNPAEWDLQQVKNEMEALEQDKRELLQEIRSAFEASQHRLPSASVPRICVFYFQPGSPVRSRMNGVMAFSASKDLVDLYVAPVAGWIPWVGYNVAHEYHHTQWMAGNPDRDPFRFTLLQYLVFEGRADNFASQTMHLSGAWSHALSAEQQCNIFEQIKPSLGETGPLLPKVMFGWPGSGFPQWSGYTLGFAIVHSFLALHPKESVESWTRMRAEDLFAGSRYSPCAREGGGN